MPVDLKHMVGPDFVSTQKPLGEEVPKGIPIYRNKTKKKGEIKRALAVEEQGINAWCEIQNRTLPCCFNGGCWRFIR